MLPPGVIIPHEALCRTDTTRYYFLRVTVFMQYSCIGFTPQILCYFWDTSLLGLFTVASFITLSLRSSSQLHKDMRDTLKGSHTGFRLFLITCWSGVYTHYKEGRAQTAVATHEDGLRTHLGSVHKLFGVVVVDAVNLQKGIWLAEEVLWRERCEWTVQQQLWD